MGMNQTDLVKHDMAYGQPMMIVTTPDDDMKGNTDLFINSLKVAYRKRRIPLNKYRQISIRAKRVSGAETEMSKIITGKTQAMLYIFEFTDAYVVCRVKDIKTCLSAKQYMVETNRDGTTKAAYISLANIPHLLIEKNGEAKYGRRYG